MTSRYGNLEGKINASTDLIGVLSLGGVVLSGLLIFSPVRSFGLIGLGGGIGSYFACAITRKKALNQSKNFLDDLQNRHRKEVMGKDDEITILTADVNSLKATLKSLEATEKNSSSEVLALQENLNYLTVQIQSKDKIIEKVTDELDRLITLARTAVEESLDEWEKRLNSLATTQKDQYPKLAERLNVLLNEGEEKLADYALKLVQTPSKWDSLEDLLSLYYCVNDDLQIIKTKIIRAISKLTQQETLLELRETEAILEEWQTANLVPRDKLEEIIKNHQALLSEIRGEFASKFETVYQFAHGLEGQTQDDDKFVQGILAKMQELESKIRQLSKPITYPGATRTDMRIANIIIGYFERLGIILDRAGSDYRGHEATLEFITDRTGRLVLSSELNEHSERLQGLIHILNKPEFKLDPETGLMTLLVRWASKPATSTSDQAKRLLTPLGEVVKKLVDNLSHKPTIRVMGATGEGKGVMVRYLLKSILASHSWYCRLHDPQHGSSEDHWGIPKVSKSGSELKLALKDIEKQMIHREANGWTVTTLDTLDEIDTHLEKREKKEAFIDLVSRIRHLGMKLILIGQNPKVGRAGFEWSDMQQMNCIYMGASAFDAIETNPQLKPRKDKLTKDYLVLSEHYERANEGLEGGEKYLFGLVVIPGKTPMWVELPRPDSIEINCAEMLLGRHFEIPNSLREFIEGKKTDKCSGNPGKTNSNSDPSAEAKSLASQQMAAIADTSDYVGIDGTADTRVQRGKATCKKHPEAELRPQKDGRNYCPVCKKRLAKADISYR